MPKKFSSTDNIPKRRRPLVLVPLLERRKKKVRWWYFHWGVVVTLGAMLGTWVQAPDAAALSSAASAQSRCADVEFIFVRGSGEALGGAGEGGKSFAAWQDNIQLALKDIDITTKFYNLGTESHHGYQYPAAAVAGSLQGIVNLVGAYVSAGDAYEFGRSVEQGQGELIYYLIEEMQQCPKMKFVLGGYSQGAMILTKTLNQLYAPRILYVATFGDPKLYLPEGAGTLRVPDACRGVNLSPYREYVPDCHAYTGVLGSVRPYQPAAYAGKIGTWCNQSDVMCSSGLSIEDHTSYVEDNLYWDAAQTIREKIKAAFPDRAVSSATTGTLHNLALLFDTTGSMQRQIRKYKAEALRLAKNVLEAGGKVRLYTYGDLQDGARPQAACAGDCTLTELSQAINNLRTKGGGDDPESLLPAAMFALNDFDWDYGATKSLVALTDDGFHPEEEGITVAKVVQRSLEIDPVNFYVLTESRCADDYTELVAQTGGALYNISDAASLELSTQQIWQRPVAKLSMPNYTGAVGSELVFDASSSYSANGEALRFDWDLDGDGEFELINAGAQVTQTYMAEFADFIQVRAYDRYGSSTMSAKVAVSKQSEGVALPKITNLQVEELENQQARIRFETDADKVLLGVGGMLLGMVELKSGAGEVVLTEASANLEVSLAPYRAGNRGETQTIVLFADAEQEGNDWPDLSNGGEGLGGDIGTPSSDYLGKLPISSTIATEVIKNYTTPTYTVPKAPETGVRSSKNGDRSLN